MKWLTTHLFMLIFARYYTIQDILVKDDKIVCFHDSVKPILESAFPTNTHFDGFLYYSQLNSLLLITKYSTILNENALFSTMHIKFTTNFDS